MSRWAKGSPAVKRTGTGTLFEHLKTQSKCACAIPRRIVADVLLVAASLRSDLDLLLYSLGATDSLERRARIKYAAHGRCGLLQGIVTL